VIIDILESGEKIQVVNIYNKKDLGIKGGYIIDRFLYNFQLVPKTLLLGDFNTHHPI
jgi:hypothetical protein